MENENKCWLCDDYDVLVEIVCYLPYESGGSRTIPINYCPICGKKIEEEA
jgi:hypothetical protein